jgi:TolB protein
MKYPSFRGIGVLILLLLSSPVSALLEVTVTEGMTGEIPVAVPAFVWEGAAAPSEDVASILGANLGRTGQFRVLSDRRLPAAPRTPDDFLAEAWASVGVEYLVSGRMRPEGERIIIEFHVYDVLANRPLGGYRIPVPAHQLRRGAHRVSDMVYQSITGDPGAFSSRIAYVTVTGEGEARRYALEVADSDGVNPQTLYRSSHSLMSPVWSPDSRNIAYVSFENRRSEIWMQNIETGNRELLAGFQGINSAPSFSPDGRRLAMTLSRDGHPNIYVMDLATRELTQITRTQAIDTEPVWAPDGRSLYFTSDRAGSPQIYRVAFPEGNAQRLTFDASSAGAAAATPDGRSIVYVHGGAGGLRIARLDLETRTVTLLTEGRLDKSPTIAPNGSIILYSTTDRGRGILGSVSRNGRVQQRLAARTGEVREPSWSW